MFDWGGMSFASHGLVYDETDQVALPKGSQSADWLAQASHSELSCEGYGVRALWDHYYLAEFSLLDELCSQWADWSEGRSWRSVPEGDGLNMGFCGA